MTNTSLSPSFYSVATPASLAHTASRGAWKPARHLMLLNRYLMDVASGSTAHLIVTMPPRHGKSSLISKYFVAWYLGVFPNRNVLVNSYGAEFASTWSEQAKAVLNENSRLFGKNAKVLKKARRSWDFSLEGGGNMATAGVGGGITGRGFNLVITDDPVKNDEEADSPIYREKTYVWYTGTVYTRQEPRVDTAYILIMTRWNEDDLAGRLIKDGEQGGIRYTVLNLPAIAEFDEQAFPWGMGRRRGEALWPDAFSLSKLRETEKVVGPRHWNALYQQRPAPEGGGMFQREWFEIRSTAPPMLRAVRYWDLAATEKLGSRDPDYTVGVLMGIDSEGTYWILDVCRFRGDPGSVEQALKTTAASDKDLPICVVRTPVKTWIEQEPGAGAKLAVRNLITKVLAGHPVFADPAGTMGETSTGRHNKIQRADPFSGQAKARNVKLLAGLWNKDVLDELCVFPNGAHDDVIDGCSGAFNRLALTRPGISATAGDRGPAVTDFRVPEMTRRSPWEDFRV